MICKICGETSEKVFSAIVREKHDATYFRCKQCGFLQAENPIWITQAYESPINDSDIGYVSRNVYLSKKTLILFYILFGRDKQYLDYAAGYGILVRLMRDYGLDFYWSDAYTKNLFAVGFEHQDERISAVTCFECFEHFVEPRTEIEKILAISNNIFFSTRLIPKSGLPDASWSYYGFDHGQHVSFYSFQTLKFIAKKYNLNIYSDGSDLHLLTPKKINPLCFRFLLFSSKFGFDLLIRKFLLKSLLIKDYDLFMSKQKQQPLPVVTRSTPE